MLAPAAQTIEVRSAAAVGAARRAARALAEAIGFDTNAAEQIALAVSELATNLVRHAFGGQVVLSPLSVPGRAGIQVESLDTGPGVVDVDRALADGYSTAGTLGAGLGAVNRLMDEFDLASEPGRGTRLVCRRWVRGESAKLRPNPLAFGVATRPRHVGDPNGDSFVIKTWDDGALVGLIDGLGHGQPAHEAAQAARQYVETHCELPLRELFRGAGRACSATRGVVMAVARFELTRQRLVFASIGNIEARILNATAPFRLDLRRGILGLNAPEAVVIDHAWSPAMILVLHTDGVKSHWSWADFPGLTNQPAVDVARHLVGVLSREEDDATVVIVRQGAP